MATVGRLTFLYPQLARAARAGCPREVHRAPVAAEWVRPRSSFAPRHGKGVEPTPPRRDEKQPPPPPPPPPPPERQQQQQQTLPAEPKAEAKPGATTRAVVPGEQRPQTTTAVEEDERSHNTAQTAGEAPNNLSPPGQASSTTPGETADGGTGSAADGDSEERARQTREEAKHSGPLEAVLHMQAPEHEAGEQQQQQQQQQHPVMSPPPYVHHFDSYSFVKQLQAGGFTNAQSVTAMKGIRGLLAQNLDVAQESLVSKSDVENETYLFRAACSELSTEIRNNRRLQDEQTRQQRTHLQHEVDNLTQSLNQELLTLNDNVRGMFNDRKMAVREEQKTVESAVQQINYKISIMLSSDSKSEIEGVRWILIRRSVLGIIFMAVLTLGTLRYATYVNSERQREGERLLREEEELRRNGGKRDNASAADAAVILAAG